MFIAIFAFILCVSINVYAEDCNGVFDPNFLNDLDRFVYKPIKYATPVLLLVLTSFDFAKVVFSGDGKGMDKAKNNFLKRSVAALIIFFAPNIIELIVGWIQDNSIASCMQGRFK